MCGHILSTEVAGHILSTEVAEVKETHTHFHFLPRRRNNTAYLPLPFVIWPRIRRISAVGETVRRMASSSTLDYVT